MKKKKRKPSVSASALPWVGQLVCVGLKNGDYYIGKLVGVKGGELVLSGCKGSGKLSTGHSESDKARISGLLGSLLGGGLGAGAAPAGAAIPAPNARAGGGLLSGIWPTIRMGMGMLQFIMPLLGKFFI